MMSHNGTASVYRSIGWTLRGGIDQQIPIKRQQRICAACESDLVEKHRVSTASLY